LEKIEKKKPALKPILFKAFQYFSENMKTLRTIFYGHEDTKTPRAIMKKGYDIWVFGD